MNKNMMTIKCPQCGKEFTLTDNDYLGILKQVKDKEFEKELNDTRTDVETTLKDVRHDLDITPELKNASEQVESGIRDIRRELRQTNQELKHTDTH